MLLGMFTNFVVNRNVNVVKMPCDVEVKQRLDVDGKKLILAEIKPYNMNELILTLKLCCIDRALVGGYNGVQAKLVLHANGAVVPFETLTAPNYALYYEKCNCVYKIVCAHSTDSFKTCKYYEVCCNVKSKTVQNVEVPNNGCCGLLPPTPCFPSTPCFPPTPCCPSRPCPPPPPCSLDDDCDCPYFSQRFKTVKNRSNGKLKCEIITAKKFVFPSNYSSVRPLLNICSYSKKSTVETINLRKEVCKNLPSILYKPSYLKKLQHKIERKIGQSVCLYITAHSCIFTYFNEKLYRVTVQGSGRRRKICLYHVSQRELKKLCMNGLYGVEFS